MSPRTSRFLAWVCSILLVAAWLLQAVHPATCSVHPRAGHDAHASAGHAEAPALSLLGDHGDHLEQRCAVCAHPPQAARPDLLPAPLTRGLEGPAELAQPCLAGAPDRASLFDFSSRAPPAA